MFSETQYVYLMKIRTGSSLLTMGMFHFTIENFMSMETSLEIFLSIQLGWLIQGMGRQMQKDSRNWEKKCLHRKDGTTNFQEDLPTTSNSFNVLKNQGETTSEAMHMDTIINNSKIQDHTSL